MNVKKWIEKFYGRKAIVINPPVPIEKFYHKSAGDYWLSIQRTVPQKRIDMQVKIFKRLPREKLIIVGEVAPSQFWYKRKLQKMTGNMKNIEWRGAVYDDEMTELYANCKGVILTSIDEDFGLVPVEAMAAGKPCLAVNEGGFSETIIHGKTGLLINKPYVENFTNAIKNFAPENFIPRLCKERAEDFSEDIFVQKIRNLIKPFNRGG
jgi:glycosyltransferase involved in cell wall biosynthesis